MLQFTVFGAKEEPTLANETGDRQRLENGSAGRSSAAPQESQRVHP